ncbi:acyl-CoA dehydrogenase family protein [Xanthobacter sp. KR7-225]|uniref:acyl-CoA dehydrogenase family protein n=1 Tax=Xanthobacter sp. KR7-225 TaxID=3156613 RepID=UPI0032B43270
MLAATLAPSATLAETAPAQVLAAVARICAADLAPAARAIDEGAYPADILRKLAGVGAFGLHARADGALTDAIEAMSVVSQTCVATGFMAWCQNTLAWYLMMSDNAALRARLLPKVVAGDVLGGTGLSNPMKAFFGIETLKLRGTRVAGGYKVKGLLPWVSNLGPDHYFGAVFALEGREGNPVMALIDCADPAVTLKPCEPFLAMDGTGTYAVQVRDLFIPDDLVLAHEAMPLVKKMRAGFILLQAGMAFGLMRDCLALMGEVEGQLGHVNRYLPMQPGDLAGEIKALEAEVMELCATPEDPSTGYFRRVVAARLAAGDACVAAANAAMLHCGARGYVAAHRCQRRLRESYFVAIVTPATKQLRLMLDQLPA